jgi:gliding motility-associated-like protein
MRTLLFILCFLSTFFSGVLNAQLDLTVTSMMPDSICNGSSLTLSVIIVNNSGTTAPAGQMEISYTEGGSPWVTETVTSPIAAGNTFIYSFGLSMDVSTCGANTVTVAIDSPLDNNSSNDTIQFDIVNICLLNTVSVLGDTVCSVPNQILEVNAFTNLNPFIAEWRTSDDGGLSWISHNNTSPQFTYANPQAGSLAQAIFDGLGICPNDTIEIVLIPQPHFVFQPGGNTNITVCDNRPDVEVIITHDNNMNDNIKFATNGDGTFDDAFDDSTFYNFGNTDYANSNLIIVASTLIPAQCPFEDTLHIDWIPSPTGVITGDTNVCLGDTVTLTGAGGFQYFWYEDLASGTGAQVVNPFQYVPTVDDTIALFVVSINTCSDTVVAFIDVFDPPIVSSVADTVLCPGDVIQLTTSSTNATSFNWLPGLGLNSTSVISPILTVQDEVSYIIEAIGAGGCIGRDTVNVSFVAGYGIDHFPDTMICLGNTIVLQTNAMGNNITWGPNLGINDITIPNPAVSPGQTTLYHITVDSGFCNFSDSILVSVDGPQGTIIFCDSIFCFGEEFIADISSPNGASYFWMVDGNFQSSTISMNMQPQDVDSMLVQCEVTTLSNCVFMIDRMIYQGSEFECGGDVNNAFSPNGDGINDTWVINVLDGTTANSVEVFTRYGDVLRSFENYDNVNIVWDGTNKSGKEMPSGVYYYVIEVNGDKIAGWVNISR